MSRKKSPQSNEGNKVAIVIAVISLIGVVITAIFGLLGALRPTEITISATQTAEEKARLIALDNNSNIVPAPALSLAELELTAKVIDAQSTQAAMATATQQYLYVMQTVQANATATVLFGTAEAVQAQTNEAIAQATISSQQTATASSINQKIDQLLGFAGQIPNLPVSFFDSFVTNDNGWSPKSSKEHAVSFKGDELKINLSDSSASPLIWTCEKCDWFSNFSYQVDIKFPKGAPGIASGIAFGSLTRLDQQPLQGYYVLLVFSSGDIFLEWISPDGSDIVKNWDHRRDLFTADGEFHTLQIIGFENYAAVYIDGKPVGDVFSLDHSTEGYTGLFVQSKNVDVVYDNFKVVLLR